MGLMQTSAAEPEHPLDNSSMAHSSWWCNDTGALRQHRYLHRFLVANPYGLLCHGLCFGGGHPSFR